MSEPVLTAVETTPPDEAVAAAEVAAAVLVEVDDSVTPASQPLTAAADQRAAVLTAVRAASDLPPGVRERLTALVQQAPTLDVEGEPLLATRQVLELLAQGLPPMLRRETATAVTRPTHPVGDAFFALNSDELSDQQAEQIARTQLQRAGLLRTA